MVDGSASREMATVDEEILQLFFPMHLGYMGFGIPEFSSSEEVSEVGCVSVAMRMHRWRIAVVLSAVL